MIFNCVALLLSTEVEYVGFYLEGSMFNYKVNPDGRIYATWTGNALGPDYMRASVFERILLGMNLGVETVVVTWKDEEDGGSDE